MKYKTSDIITKALQIADLTNSDFISWYEKVSMINDAYTMLYQKLIDIGDGSFCHESGLYSFHGKGQGEEVLSGLYAHGHPCFLYVSVKPEDLRQDL